MPAAEGGLNSLLAGAKSPVKLLLSHIAPRMDVLSTVTLAPDAGASGSSLAADPAVAGGIDPATALDAAQRIVAALHDQHVRQRHNGAEAKAAAAAVKLAADKDKLKKLQADGAKSA